MSTPESGRVGYTYGKVELQNIAKEAEKFPKDPKEKSAAKDLTRRIYLAIRAFPAYKNHDGGELARQVRETLKGMAKAKETPDVVTPPPVVEKKEAGYFPKPAPRYVEPLRPMTDDDIDPLMHDAIANEKRQPRAAYDAEAEEDVRRPLSSAE
jgi:hypothetical protein